MVTKNKKYGTGEVTVFWKPELCIHSANCVKHLPSVFNPNERPWVKVDAASASEIRATIDKCPSGALSYESSESEKTEIVKVEITKNGPYILTGDFVVKNTDGTKVEVQKKVALCRCGASANKPFCDGAHKAAGFAG